MRGNTALMRMYSEIPKTTNVQIIRPTLGVISHESLEAIGGWDDGEGLASAYRKKAMKPPTRP